MVRFFSVLFFGLALTATAAHDTVTQVSTIDALLAGVYDGAVSCRTLLKHGDFGIGTFDRLDGEMIVLDGKVYKAASDGTVVRMSKKVNTPFASVVDFRADREMTVGELDFETLKKLFDEEAAARNHFYAFRVCGNFPYVKVRSVPAQEKPYPPLAEVAAKQAVFEYRDQRGTLIGFRCPEYVKGVNVPGYHFHFLSDDRQRGGHVLDLRIESAQAATDLCDRFYMMLPEENAAFSAAELDRDRSRELEQVEK